MENHQRFLRDATDDLDTRLRLWRSNQEAYARPRADALFDAWLSSIKTKFRRDAENEYKSQHPPPTLEGVIRQRVAGTVPRDNPNRDRNIDEQTAALLAAYESSGAATPTGTTSGHVYGQWSGDQLRT